MIKPRHEIIRRLIGDAGSTFVSVFFLKKDGTERKMTFNPRDFNEIKGTGHGCADPNIFRVREINNKEEGKTSWRSFDARRVVKISLKGKEVEFGGIEVDG